MNTQTGHTILDKIKVENIKPKAKWYFMVQHVALWVPGILVTGIGAIAVAGELYALTHTGWEYREFVYPSTIAFFIAMVPVLWMASFVLFGSLIVRALRTTHRGYRFSTKAILLGSITTSVIVGVGAYIFDELLKADTFIRYPVHVREEAVWFSPDMGRLLGSIEVKNDHMIILRDKDNMVWTIDMSGFGTTSFPFVEEGNTIRIIGTSTDDHLFVACAVFPWELGGFPRSQTSSSSFNRSPKVRAMNKNPDCKIVLESLKERILRR